MVRRLAVVACLAIAGMLPILLSGAHARDDGRYTDSPLKSWFENLASHRGMCCSFADGVSIRDVDWDTVCDHKNPDDCRYRVRLDDKWVDVPEAALVMDPNKLGTAVVWPVKLDDGTVTIRCFMPGGGT